MTKLFHPPHLIRLAPYEIVGPLGTGGMGEVYRARDTRLDRTVEQKDPEVAGFNVGINSGEVAGQTVQHCHLHLVPRRVGDVENPVGGIRNVIPGKGPY